MEFLQSHWLDITTTALGLAYILLEYKASLWLWPVGFLMQALGIVLYWQKGLYADCGMEVYYIAMTVYGFINWTARSRRAAAPGAEAAATSSRQELPVTHFERRWILPWLLGTLAIWFALWYFLSHFTDSRVPLADSFTTALSFVGLWALARKYLEQWLIWIVVDVVTCGLYFYKGIPFKASLYGLYIIIAVFGYRRWRSSMSKEKIVVIS